MYNPELTNNISYNKCSTVNYIYFQYMIYTNIHTWKTFHKISHIRKKRKYLTDFNNFLTISQQNETSVPIGTHLYFLFIVDVHVVFFLREFDNPLLTLAIQFPKCLNLKSQEFLLNWAKVSYSVTFSYSFTLHWASIYSLHSLLPMNKVLNGLIFNFENKKNIFSRKNKYANITEKSQLMILPI